jgi:peptide-methionine (S)-S-oxide reductase
VSLDTKQKIIVGAGCFWGVQFYFDQVPGVVRTVVGYSGGNLKNPTYEQVCNEDTGHAEVVLIEYDSKVLKTKTLLRHFFRLHNPTELNRQGPDVGTQYRSVIYYNGDEQKMDALSVKDEHQAKYDSPIVTEIKKAKEFYEAEEYHQKYAQKTGRGMCHVEYTPIS